MGPDGLLLVLATACFPAPGRGLPQRARDVIGEAGPREGDYNIRGFLAGYASDYSGGFGRSSDYRRGGDTCPYENVMVVHPHRRRRAVDNQTEDAKSEDDSSSQEEGALAGQGESALLARVRRQLVGTDRYKDDWDRGYRPGSRYRTDGRGRSLSDPRDNGYRPRSRDIGYNRDRPYYRDDRYRDNSYYRDDRYRDNSDYRDNRYRTDPYYDDRRRYEDPGWDGGYSGRGRDRCGREACSWVAELECDDSDYYGGAGVEWEREHDAYYPKNKYRDLLDYLGGRARQEGGRLVILEVRPEDKGVYRCYKDRGLSAPGDFTEIHFFPKFPIESNEEC